jgi:alkanesulfonate monooxygenase SsuD/methylene tetrahydromethanopterin reductase-like flavin-dependent oxidoreductase (luciferase family)
VKIGLFLDLRNPPAWQRPWDEHYSTTVETVVEAERLGIDAIWLSEHHLFGDGYLPQPLTFGAALAQATSRIRIGTAILIAALRHPRHVAEEAAIVDLVSGGRLELGIGAGWSRSEYEAFGVEHERRFGVTEARVREIRDLLADPNLTPPPLQRPLPLWLGAMRPLGARRAGRLGVGMLSLDRALLAPYREGLAAAGLPPGAARMGGLVEIVLADDPEATAAELRPYREHQVRTYAEVRDPGFEGTVHDDGLRVLTPEGAATEIGQIVEGLPVEHVYLWLSVGGMPEEIVRRHAELTAGPLRAALAASHE